VAFASFQNLIERAPELTELKVELLKTLLAKKRFKSEDMIYARFAESSVKGDENASSVSERLCP